jgi:hypothetical protein
MDERDWVTELLDAGALVRTESKDSNGNFIYRVGTFPPGEEGARLKKLFDQNVKQAER